MRQPFFRVSKTVLWRRAAPFFVCILFRVMGGDAPQEHGERGVADLCGRERGGVCGRFNRLKSI